MPTRPMVVLTGGGVVEQGSEAFSPLPQHPWQHAAIVEAVFHGLASAATEER